MSNLYDYDGNPIPLKHWMRLFDDPDRQIADDTVNGHRLSTVWIGIDHSFGTGPPLIYETMLDPGAGGTDQWRWSTREEAMKGHAEQLKALQLIEAAF